MNIIRQPLLATIVAVGLATALPAAPADTNKDTNKQSSVDVVFFEPEKFTDVRDRDQGTHEKTTYLEQMKEHLQRTAANLIPPGYKLSVTFSDIDMAGEFEPWRGPQFSDIRIVKEIYPPRMSLTFQLMDPQGNVVSQGERKLADAAYMWKLTAGFRDDPLRHEKQLLDDWVNREFREFHG